MNRLAFPRMAISKAFPALSARSSSSSPSSLALSITAGDAPWNRAQGMRSKFESASVLSDHPPDMRWAGSALELADQVRRATGVVHARSTRMARISHNDARVIDNVLIESCVASFRNCTLLRSRQKTTNKTYPPHQLDC